MLQKGITGISPTLLAILHLPHFLSPTHQLQNHIHQHSCKKTFGVQMSNFWTTHDSLRTTARPASFINRIALTFLSTTQTLSPELKPYVLAPFMAVASVFIVLLIASELRGCLHDGPRRSHNSDRGIESESDGESGGEIYQAVPVELLPPYMATTAVAHRPCRKL